jgi:hypothetical protein
MHHMFYIFFKKIKYTSRQLKATCVDPFKKKITYHTPLDSNFEKSLMTIQYFTIFDMVQNKVVHLIIM